MHYALLFLIVVFCTGQNVLKQKYNSHCTGGVYFFSGMIALFAMLFFMAVNRDWTFRPGQLIPAAAFAAAYAAATLCAVLAIKHGSLALTSLFISYSLLIPCFYGILFLQEPVGWTLILGFILLAISLWLTNYQKSSQPISVKWLLLVLLAFLGNGMCSTVQKAEQQVFAQSEQNMIMILALGMVALILLGISLFSKERTQWKDCYRAGVPLALLCGLMNGGVNALVLYLNQHLPASVMFPVISAGGLILIMPYSILVCRERFSTRQWIGFAAGVASVVLLNL
ncbi:MAG: EamA family transporter [Clostridia bacterium]|nr:EamA family transporter [Clostridia bacterium]